MFDDNLFGILSDEASVMRGLLGYQHLPLLELKCLFEPIHGHPKQKVKYSESYPSILSAAMLLEHFGLYD
jgi:isocitrate/isopropylmalate dehydrogenase